jgi:broad specificity phosphatase PhoE
MRIYLIRHGQKEHQMGDPVLTSLGVEQANKTGRYFVGKNIEVIVASPRTRTQQTARIIGENIGLPVETNPLLVERSEWLDPTQTFQEYEQQWRETSKDRTLDPGPGDSSIATGNRVARVIDALLVRGVASAILVSHGGSITDYLSNTVGQEYLLANYFEEEERYVMTDVPECSITEIEVEKEKIKIISLFGVGHL